MEDDCSNKSTIQYKCVPRLRVVNQPQKCFRFRYISEMGRREDRFETHGRLLAEYKGPQKEYPSVQLDNWHGEAIIKCRLVQESTSEESPHYVQADDDSRNEPIRGERKAVSKKIHVKFVSEPVEFKLGIIYTPLKDYIQKMIQANNGDDEATITLKAKQINFNIIRLEFTAYDVHHKKICGPVYSDPVRNNKSPKTNELRICRIDRVSGSVHGNDEIYILTEKVTKNNIKVRFLEVKEDKEVWSSEAMFTPGDVHHQFAIVFRTPPYKDVTVVKNVKVWVELYRPSDYETSERHPFTYVADPVHVRNKKRKASEMASSSLSSGSVGDLPTTVRALHRQFNNISIENDQGAAAAAAQTVPLGDDYAEELKMRSAFGDVNHDFRINYDVPTSNPSVRPADCQSTSQLSGISDSDLIQNLLPPEDIKKYKEFFKSNELSVYNDSVEKMYSNAPMRDEDFNFRDILPIQADDAVYHDANDLPMAQMEKIFFQNTSNWLPTYQGIVTDGVSCQKNTTTEMASPKQETDNQSIAYTAKYSIADQATVNTHLKTISSLIKEKNAAKNDVDVKRLFEDVMKPRLSNGDTLLHMLVATKSTSVLHYMLHTIRALGLAALARAQNDAGESLLVTAVHYDALQYTRQLLASGCDPMLGDSAGRTALHHVALSDRRDHVRALLAGLGRYHQHHFTLDPRDNQNMTPALLAAQYDKSDALAALLEGGADLRAQDGGGRRALHLAAAGGHARAVRAILRHTNKDEVDAADGNGNTALQMACGAGVSEATLRVVELLCQHGANPLKSSGGNSCPLKLASGHAQIVRILNQYKNDDAIEIKSEPEDCQSDGGSSSESESDWHCPPETPIY